MKLPVNYNNLTPKQRKQVREFYCQWQDWKCIHCNAHLTKPSAVFVQNMKIDLGLFPTGFLKNPIHLHHDHTTGLTIGAVHAKCNAVLWQYHGQ